LCRASGLAARIDADRVPLSPAAKKALGADQALIGTLLTGGDDYELLVTLDRNSWRGFSAECEAKGVAVALIGETLSGEAGLVRVMQSRRELDLEQSGFSHL
jgi:thiamine-monophosphate kinase